MDDVGWLKLLLLLLHREREPLPTTTRYQNNPGGAFMLLGSADDDRPTMERREGGLCWVVNRLQLPSMAKHIPMDTINY